MKKKVLALFDSNQKYMEKMYHYLEDETKLHYTYMAFTSEDKLTAFLERESIDFLIVSEDKRRSFTGVKRIISIYENAQNDGLYRFCPGDEIVTRLTELLGVTDEENEIQGFSRTKLIGVYSPVGRVMKTSFCAVLGQMLAKNYRVLYLNFESFSGMNIEDSVEKKADLADVLYYFYNLKHEFRAKFHNSIINHNGLDMIQSAYYYLDLSYITQEEWDSFINELTAMNEYDYVILDLSDYLQGLFDSFLSRCTIIYTLSAPDRKAQSKIFHYETILNEYNRGDILSKTRKFNVPTIRNLPDSLDRLLYTELADFVRKETASDFKW